MNLPWAFLGVSTNQFLEIVWFMAVFSILAMSLNLVVGQTGLFQLGQVGFFAIGGIVAIFVTHPDHLGLDFVLGLVAAAAVGALAAFLLGLPTLRLRGDYFAIATLGFGIAVAVALRVYFVQGVYNIPPLDLLGRRIVARASVEGRQIELVAVLLIAVLVYVFLQRLIRSPFGRTLRAIREDELAAGSLGKDVVAVKMKAFVLSGALASIAGVLYVHHLGVFDPSAYSFSLTILMLVIIILGGLGSNQGAVLGTILVTLLNELAKDISGSIEGVDAAALNIMVFSALLVALMVLRPQGLLGDRDFDARALFRRLGGGGGHGPTGAGVQDAGEAEGGEPYTPEAPRDAAREEDR